MNRILFWLLIVLSLTISAKGNKKPKEVITYPVTKKINHTDTYFETTVEDPYQWLEDDTSAQTAAWVEAQNKVTFDYLDKIPFRQQLKERYKELFDFAKLNNPVIAGDYLFFEKKEGLQNLSISALA